VNLTARTGLTGGPLAYLSFKARPVGLTRELAIDLAPLNVTVNTVAPSPWTPLVEQGAPRKNSRRSLRVNAASPSPVGWPCPKTWPRGWRSSRRPRPPSTPAKSSLSPAEPNWRPLHEPTAPRQLEDRHAKEP